MLEKHKQTVFQLRMQASFYFALLAFFCLLVIAASRDEELSKEKDEMASSFSWFLSPSIKETKRSVKPVRVADGEMSRKAETVKTWSVRSADRKSLGTNKGKKKGALKKKKSSGRTNRQTEQTDRTNKGKKKGALKKKKSSGRTNRQTEQTDRTNKGKKKGALKKKKKSSGRTNKGKKKGALKKKKSSSRKTSKIMRQRKDSKVQRKGKKKAGKGQERKEKQARRRKERKLDKKGKKEKCPSSSTRKASSRAINGTCLVNILTIVETYFKQVGNFEKQWKRIVSKNKTSVSKGGKMDAFKKPLERLVKAGGGDAKNLSCQGSTSNPGALQMKNLTSILTNCSQDIEAACDESQKPTINTTEVDKCISMIAEFKESVDGTAGCLKKTGADLCDCFANQTLLDQAAVLRKCNLAKESQTMATALKTCKGKYGNCRKYKEEIIGIVSACSKTSDKQMEKAKALGENVDNMKEAQDAVAKVTGSGGRHFFNNRSSFNRRIL